MTAQVSNRMLIDGHSHHLLSDPLPGFFNKRRRRPSFCAVETANWRGYVTTWQIAEGKLYLVDLVGTVCCRAPDKNGTASNWCKIGHDGACEVAEIQLSDIDVVPPGGFLAEWFSGELRLPQGDLVHYEHIGWASTFESDLCVSFKRGRELSRRVVSAEERLAQTYRPKRLVWPRLRTH